MEVGASYFLPTSHSLVHCLWYKQSDPRSKSDWAISLPTMTPLVKLFYQAEQGSLGPPFRQPFTSRRGIRLAYSFPGISTEHKGSAIEILRIKYGTYLQWSYREMINQKRFNAKIWHSENAPVLITDSQPHPWAWPRGPYQQHCIRGLMNKM